MAKSPSRTKQRSKRPDRPRQNGNEDLSTSQIIAAEAHYEFSGPLPPPETLARYNEILPGAADRIIGLAESETRHRQALERDVIHRDYMEARIGQICGLLIAITGLVGAVIVGIQGSAWTGSALAGATVAGLVTAFIYGRSGTNNRK